MLQVLGGASRTIGRDAALILDAVSASVDPDTPSGSVLGALFSWACEAPPHQADYLLPSQPCPPSVADALLTPAAAAGRAELAGGSLLVGTRFRFYVEARKRGNGLITRTSQLVVVVDGIPPAVVMSSPSQACTGRSALVLYSLPYPLPHPL